jgi:hypothetical protein
MNELKIEPEVGCMIDFVLKQLFSESQTTNIRRKNGRKNSQFQ